MDNYDLQLRRIYRTLHSLNATGLLILAALIFIFVPEQQYGGSPPHQFACLLAAAGVLGKLAAWFDLANTWLQR